MPRRLTAKQLAAAAMLARGCVQDEIRVRLKLRRTTLERWRVLPEFVQEIARAVGETREATQQRLSILFDASVAAMKQELARTECNPKRIQTALSVLKLLGVEQILLNSEQIMCNNVQIMCDNEQIMRESEQKSPG